MYFSHFTVWNNILIILIIKIILKSVSIVVNFLYTSTKSFFSCMYAYRNIANITWNKEKLRLKLVIYASFICSQSRSNLILFFNWITFHSFQIEKSSCKKFIWSEVPTDESDTNGTLIFVLNQTRHQMYFCMRVCVGYIVCGICDIYTQIVKFSTCRPIQIFVQICFY